MKNKNSLFAFILVVATLAAAAAIILTNIKKICEFLETCRKTGEEYCLSRDRGCKCPPPVEEDSDFEDVEL